MQAGIFVWKEECKEKEYDDKNIEILLMLLLCGVQTFWGFGGRYGPNRSGTRNAFRNWAMAMNQLVIDDRIGAMVSKYQATM